MLRSEKGGTKQKPSRCEPSQDPFSPIVTIAYSACIVRNRYFVEDRSEVDSPRVAGTPRCLYFVSRLKQAELSRSIISSYLESCGMSCSLSQKSDVDMQGHETSQNIWRIVFANIP